MINRTIAATFSYEVDLFRISGTDYIRAPLFIVFFVDLIVKGLFRVKSKN